MALGRWAWRTAAGRHFKQRDLEVGILGARGERARYRADWQVSKQQLLDEETFMVQLAAVS